MLDGHIHCYWSGLPVANITTHAGIHAANNDNGLVWGKGGNVRLAVMPDGHAKLPQGIEERRVVRDHNKQQAKRYGARFLDRAGIEPAAPAPVKAAAPVKAPAPAPATGGAVPEDAADWIKASPALSARFTAIMADLATVAIPHSAKVTAAEAAAEAERDRLDREERAAAQAAAERAAAKAAADEAKRLADLRAEAAAAAAAAAAERAIDEEAAAYADRQSDDYDRAMDALDAATVTVPRDVWAAILATLPPAVLVQHMINGTSPVLTVDGHPLHIGPA